MTWKAGWPGAFASSGSEGAASTRHRVAAAFGPGRGSTWTRKAVTPERAAVSVTVEITRHLGVPNA